MTLSRAARVFAVLFAGAAPVAASTWIVDDLPGPGVDFTTIADAEAASVAGDVILVRPGSYAGFTVDIGVAILGDPGASITGRVVITSLPQSRRATLAGFSMRGLLVQDCAAPVLLEDLVFRPTTTAELGDATAAVRVQGSVDVRFRAIELTPVVLAVANQPIAGVSVSASRVELTGSTVSGAHGRSCSNYTYEAPAAQGGHGILANQFGSVRIGGTNVSGGHGGWTAPGPGLCNSWFPNAADAGDGVRVVGSSDVIVSGLAAHAIAGGQGGLANAYCSEDGEPGNGISISGGALRFSGATAIGQSYDPYCGGSVAAIDGPYVQPPIADPVLTSTGTAQPGGAIVYTVHGEPGARARLRIGRLLAVVDVPNADEDRLIVPLRTFDLGFLPASGTASFTLPLSNALPRGFLVVAQATVESPGGEVALTHSVPRTIR